MTAIEVLGLVGTASAGTAYLASGLFCTLATAFAILWARRFQHGPLEWLMRRLTG